MNDRELSTLSRGDLVRRAEDLGVDNAGLLTRAELADEIVRRTVADPVERRLARGWVGLARDLLARIVERGLHLPGAAALVRGGEVAARAPERPPIATVTLAEIYAAQGHRARALSVLDEVLASEPDHAEARGLRDQVAAEGSDPSRDEISVEPSGAPEERRDEGDGAAVPGAHRPGQEEASRAARVDEGADQVTLLDGGPKGLCVSWRLGSPSLERLRMRQPAGALVVRIAAVTPSWEGARFEIRDLEVDAPVGGSWVTGLPARAALRAAAGWRPPGGFEPLAVAFGPEASAAGVAIAGALVAPSESSGERSSAWGELPLSPREPGAM